MFFQVNAANLLYGYFFTSLVLLGFAEKASPIRRFWFAFLVSVVFQTLMVYVPYVLSGFTGLGAMLPYLTTPNPLFALLAYVLGIRILKISKYRLVHLVSVFYLFCLVLVCLSRAISFAFFVQTGGPHNYMLDAASVLCSASLSMVIYLAAIHLMRRKNAAVRIADSFVTKSLVKANLYMLLIVCLAYIAAVLPQVVRPNDPFAMFVTSLELSLSLVISILHISAKYQQMSLQNKEIHIQALRDAVERFRGIKHDFYNVLHTYSGYISLANMEDLKAYHEQLLSATVSAGEHMDALKKVDRHPAFAALLAIKREYAEHQNVHFRIAVIGSLENLYIEEIDMCRVVANLLDNAVEAAAESRRRRVGTLIETKRNGNILIVITNSIQSTVDMRRIADPGFTTKENHSGLGIGQVRKIVNKYPNCSMQFNSTDEEFSVYLEILSM